MQNISKYKILIWVALLLMCLSFLILQSGVWAYMDASYQFIMANNFKLFVSSLFDISWYTYIFAGDRAQLLSGRYIQVAIEMLLKVVFGLKRWAILLYTSYFAANYFLTQKILSIYISPKYAYMWALLYTFNPLSIYMLNQVWFLYVYTAVPLIIYGIHTYFFAKSLHVWGLFLAGIGTVFLTSYTRFMLLYILFFGVFALLYCKDIWTIIQKYTGKCIILCIALFFINIPFIFSVVYPAYSWENKYFGWVSNYTETYRSMWWYSYQKHKEQSLIDLIVPLEPTGNFAYELKENNYFIVFCFLYFSAILFFLLYKQFDMPKSHRIILSLWVLTISLWVTFRVLSHYVSEDIFVYISYTLLPFLANNSAFSHRLTLAGISMLLPLALHYWHRVIQILLGTGTLVYCIWVSSILLFFADNHKLNTVNVSPSNPIYSIFHGTGSEIWRTMPIRWSISYPSSYLLFDRAPYPLPINLIPGLAHGIETNERSSSSRQMEVGKYLSNMSGLNKHIENLSILNISSFLVMQNVRNSIPGVTFDFYNNEGEFVNKSLEASKLLNNNSWVVLWNRNALYKIYNTLDADEFLFSLYLPKSLIYASDYKTILNEPFDLTARPVFVDAWAYNKPWYIKSGYIVDIHTWQKIYIKTTYKSQFSYYIKLSNIRPGQDILLQLNKTFGVWRKIKHSNQQIFDSIWCEKEFSYPISNNTFCFINTLFPSLQNILHVLFAGEYENIDHFGGNILGNTRVIHNATFIDPDGNIYILISNDKQYISIVMQAVAVSTLIVLLGMTLYYFIRRYYKIWDNF